MSRFLLTDFIVVAIINMPLETIFPDFLHSGSNTGIRVSQTAAESIANATVVPVLFASATVDYNDGGFTGPSSGVVTVTEAGRYFVSAHLRWIQNSNGTYRCIELLINGVREAPHSVFSGFSAGRLGLHTADIFELAANSTVQMIAIQNSGAALDIAGPGDAVNEATELIIQRIR